jgi:acyl-CoA dehydrogenase
LSRRRVSDRPVYTDARVARIYAGTSEAMKAIIAKSLGL